VPPSTEPTPGEPTSTGDEQLSNQQYVLVILRLLLDEHRQLVHGEVVDEAGQLHSRFRDWRGMAAAVRSWIAFRRGEGDDRQSIF
jgi:hypothetical protein